MAIPDLQITGAVARITLRRPDQANRLEPDDLAALIDHIAEVNASPEVLVLQLLAEGKYFCSGYDISRIGGARTVAFDTVVNAIEDARPVTLAVLQGSAYGGATDIALACDFRLGCEGIDMFMPAARLGLHFYQRGLERYVSRLGLDTAKRLFLTADRIVAQEMLAMGFLTQLESREALGDAVDRLTETLSGMAPIPLIGMKKHLNRIGRGTLDEADLQHDIGRSMASADLLEGQRAWAEKRKPRFSGR